MSCRIVIVKVVEERTSFDQKPMVWLENYEAQQHKPRLPKSLLLRNKRAMKLNLRILKCDLYDSSDCLGESQSESRFRFQSTKQ